MTRIEGNSRLAAGVEPPLQGDPAPYAPAAEKEWRVVSSREIEARVAELAARFNTEILKPVSGKLPGGVRLQTDTVVTQVNGAEVAITRLKFSHDVMPDGKPLSLRYFVFFGDTREVSTTGIPDLCGKNAIMLPAKEWNESMREEIQRAWRRMTIADPLLNSRFTAKDLVLAPYQHSALEAVESDFKTGDKSLIVMGTGLGKTVVYCRAADLLLKMRAQAGIDSERPAILIIVNDRQILRDAERSVRRPFGDQFKTSRMYEGEEDFSGDFILATPRSLMSGDMIKSSFRLANNCTRRKR